MSLEIGIIYWWCFGTFNLLLCLGDIYKQGFCKNIDLIAALVMFLSEPFGSIMVILHYNSERVNNVLEGIIWQKKKSYNDFLKEAHEKRRKH